MHRDYMTTGPMVGYGFSRTDMLKYNFTDQELLDNFSPGIASQLAIRRDQLIAERQVWRTTIRLLSALGVMMIVVVWWLFRVGGDVGV